MDYPVAYLRCLTSQLSGINNLQSCNRQSPIKENMCQKRRKGRFSLIKNAICPTFAEKRQPRDIAGEIFIWKLRSQQRSFAEIKF